ncbi:hypothetical protein FRB93_004763 [Tulasnella sp. JGI-2019a]|nr:hypothetical protein FRB93_004763 [Tulasnella sp. JGI-2019a]
MRNIWPADLRIPPPVPPRRKGKQKEVGENALRRSDAPLIEFGLHTAATLINVNGRLTWEHIRPVHDKNEPRYQIVKSAQVTPDSRSDTPTVPNVTAYQRAEQGARFLRTYYPDVDVGMDILQPFLMEDHQVAARPPLFDRDTENCLATAWVSSSAAEVERGAAAVLLSASGEIRGCLSASLFLGSGEGFRSLACGPTILKDFKIPISQISVAPRSEDGVTLIAVRTTTLVVVASLALVQPITSQDITIKYTELDVITLANTNARPIVDIAFNPLPARHGTHPQMLMVNKDGDLWLWNTGGALKPSLTLLCQASEMPDDCPLSPTDCFWRVAWGNETMVYAINLKTLARVDTSVSPAKVTTAITMRETDGHLTSILSARENVLCFCSSQKIFWIDAASGLPLVMWDHEREGSNLWLHWLPSNKELSVCVSSSTDDILTVYPLSSASLRGLLYANSLSYIIIMPFSGAAPAEPRRGILLFRHPLEPADSLSFYIVSSASRGSILQSLSTTVPLGTLNSGVTPSPLDKNELACRRRKLDLEATHGPLGARESTVLDLRTLYEEIFMASKHSPGDISNNNVEIPSSDGSNAMRAMLENTAGILQLDDVSAPLLCITYDFVLRPTPDIQHLIQVVHSSNGPFNTPSQPLSPDLSCVTALNAIQETSAWTFNLSQTMTALCPADLLLPTGIDDLDTQRYHRYDPAQEDHLSTAEDRISKDCSKLAMDLVMALDVFSKIPFKLGDIVDNSPSTILSAKDRAVSDLREATAMLSRASLVEKEPPPVQYGFLSPTYRKKRGRSGKGSRPPSDDTEDKVEEEDVNQAPIAQPLGVRLLLKEWTIGDDPKDYVYVNTYAPASDSSRINPLPRFPIYSTTPIALKPPAVGSQSQVRTSQRPIAPPTISGASASQPGAVVAQDRQLRTPLSSQGAEPVGQGWANTQPVAGAFGSRANISTKAKSKKRVGGF